jgi:hypothetical protein
MPSATLLLGSIVLLAVSQTGKSALSVGTDFILAFPCFDDATWFPSFLVINSNSQPSTVTITSSVDIFTTMEKTVAGNSALQISITDVHVLLSMRVCDRDIVNQQAFRVHTSEPIALYAYFSQQNGAQKTGQYLVLPTNMLTSQYVATYTYAILIANVDGTQLTIGTDKPPKQVTLNKLDVYLTDSKIVTGNVSFAYLCTDGSTRVNIVMPASYASMQYSYAVGGGADIWAFESNTQVSVNKGTSSSVSIGTPYYTNIGGPGTVEASAPVQIFSLSYYRYMFVKEAALSSSVQFYSFGNSPTLTIVVPLLSTGNILLDGQAIPALSYQRIPYTKDYYYSVSITGAAMLHTLSTKTPSDRYMPDLGYIFAFNFTGGAS